MALMAASPRNGCVEAGRAGTPWCGNILALRMGRSSDFCESVDMEEDLKPW